MTTAIQAIEVTPEFKTETLEVLVSDWRLERIQEKIKVFNRKAKKLNAPEAEIVSVTDEPKWVKDNGPNGGHEEIFNKVVVNYSVIKHAGKWNVLGSVEPVTAGAVDGSDITVVNLKPGVPGNFAAFRHHDMSCDHCAQKRKRNKVVLVEDFESKEVYSVGTSCLLNFTGIDPRMALLWETFGSIITADEDEEIVRCGRDPEPPADALEAAITVLRIVMKTGSWIKADNYSGDMGTWADVHTLTFPAFGKAQQEYKAELEAEFPVTEEVVVAAQEVVDNFASMDLDNESNEFRAKMITFAKAGMLRFKHLRAFSAGVAFAHIGKVAAKAKAAATAGRVDEFIDAVGKRITFTGNILRIRFLSHGQFGERWLVSGRDAEGREWTWFTGPVSDDLKEGDEVTVTGTIKDHTTHPKFGKSTVLTRCKIKGV